MKRRFFRCNRGMWHARGAAAVLIGLALAFGAGCAVNPVTGNYQAMLVPASQDVALDRQGSPSQFSADYGVVRDQALNAYVNSVGQRVARITHRHDVPYNFRVVNAVYANAYAFPGGSIAVTRGLLAELHDESELAALLGHELAHVNYRHTGQAITRAQFTQLALAGIGQYVAAEHERYASAAAGLSSLGGTLFLASYSRDNEREADALGLDYLVRAGYAPQGMVDLMGLMRGLSQQEPSRVQVLFSTHPMSSERFASVSARARGTYGGVTNGVRNQTAFEQATAALRATKPALKLFSQAEAALANKQPAAAQKLLEQGLQALPGDYAGLLLMAKCQLDQNRPTEAVRFAEQAQVAYPGEPQAQTVLAQARFALKQYDQSLAHLQLYERALPANPLTAFYSGLCLERMGRVPQAANAYRVFLNRTGEASASQSWAGQHAISRLRLWTAPAPAAGPRRLR